MEPMSDSDFVESAFLQAYAEEAARHFDRAKHDCCYGCFTDGGWHPLCKADLTVQQEVEQCFDRMLEMTRRSDVFRNWSQECHGRELVHGGAFYFFCDFDPFVKIRHDVEWRELTKIYIIDCLIQLD